MSPRPGPQRKPKVPVQSVNSLIRELERLVALQARLNLFEAKNGRMTWWQHDQANTKMHEMLEICRQALRDRFKQ